MLKNCFRRWSLHDPLSRNEIFFSSQRSLETCCTILFRCLIEFPNDKNSGNSNISIFNRHLATGAKSWTYVMALWCYKGKYHVHDSEKVNSRTRSLIKRWKESYNKLWGFLSILKGKFQSSISRCIRLWKIFFYISNFYYFRV